MRAAGIHPAKSLGQHFLSDYGVVSRIVASAGAGPEDTVIEVGPGLGVLTRRLAERAGHVIAVEIDAALAQRLREELSSLANVAVVEHDVLTAAPATLLREAGRPQDEPYLVVGNLPYNAGTAIVRHFLEAAHQPRSMVVMLQREVADSLVAGPGNMSLLGVSVQVYARARKLFNVPPRAFYPPPKVTSSVVQLEVRSEPLVPLAERDRFFRVARAGFSAPRKQLRNSLAQGLGVPGSDASAAIESIGLDATRRPQDLSVDDWLRLSRAVGG